MLTSVSCPCPWCHVWRGVACLARGSRGSLGRAWRFFNTPIPGTCVYPSRREVDPRLTRPEKPVYVLSSWFLHECFALVTETPDESLHFVAAIEENGCYYLCKIIRFRLDHQSPGGASGDMGSTHDAAVQAGRFGHHLCGLFHSHPGCGVSATRPSTTDMNTHKLFERGGYPLIGMIASRDGYVRFFSHGRAFSVRTFGSKLEKVSDDVYKLEFDSLRPVPMSYVGATGCRGSRRHNPASWYSGI